MLFVRPIILFVCWLLLASSTILAKEHHWTCFLPFPLPCLEGLKFRYGLNNYFDDIKLDGIGNIVQKNRYINSQTLINNENFKNSPFNDYQIGDEFQSSITVEFVENRWKNITWGRDRELNPGRRDHNPPC